eukprot:TRINITY_DN3847_c0_g2_i3.p2 TRINITY_DN3847_c0_g2~~TRINITY_DN3847_c0_g2_i3.p2  ORF type:complete len:108 (+),score=10.80 TRINITY_DN3847_c0_g2_i3:1605-1928(+)
MECDNFFPFTLRWCFSFFFPGGLLSLAAATVVFSQCKYNLSQGDIRKSAMNKNMRRNELRMMKKMNGKSGYGLYKGKKETNTRWGIVIAILVAMMILFGMRSYFVDK